MLQMPINQIQRIARKEAGEEDGGRASCAAAVHNNTQLLAQIEELCEHLKVED
jgi:histone H3/H4